MRSKKCFQATPSSHPVFKPADQRRGHLQHRTDPTTHSTRTNRSGVLKVAGTVAVGKDVAMTRSNLGTTKAPFRNTIMVTGGSSSVAEVAGTDFAREVRGLVLLRRQPTSFDALCVKPQAATTVSNRIRVYDRFLEFCSSQCIQVSAPAVISFLSNGLREHKWHTSTLVTYRTHLCQMLEVHGWETPATLVHLRKLPLQGNDPLPHQVWAERSERILSPAALRSLLLCPNVEFRAFFELLLTCAGRAADALPSFSGPWGLDYLKGGSISKPISWVCSDRVRVVDFNDVTKSTHYASQYTREDHLSFVVFSPPVLEYFDSIQEHAPVFTFSKSDVSNMVPKGVHSLKHTSHNLFCRAVFDTKTHKFPALRSIFCKHLGAANSKSPTAHYSDKDVLEMCIRHTGIHYAMVLQRELLCTYAQIPSCVPKSLLYEARTYFET